MIHRRGEHLARLYWNRRVARDDDIHQPAERLDAERQRRDVQQQYVLETTAQNFRLDRRAERDRFIGILSRIQQRPAAFVIVLAKPDAAAFFLKLRATKPFTHELAHQRHPRLHHKFAREAVHAVEVGVEMPRQRAAGPEVDLDHPCRQG